MPEKPSCREGEEFDMADDTQKATYDPKILDGVQVTITNPTAARKLAC
jgi:hypothetical protein